MYLSFQNQTKPLHSVVLRMVIASVMSRRSFAVKCKDFLLQSKTQQVFNGRVRLYSCTAS